MSQKNKCIFIHSPEELDALLPVGAKLFFIGIGGVSMSALAVIAKEKGYITGGSDRTLSHNTEMLENQGISVVEGHAAAHVHGWDAVIYNAAIGESNPEYAEAEALGIPLVYRADFLAFLMQGYENSIGIAGMHGKSTTSAMLSHLFLEADRDPAILIGAELPELGRDFRYGHGHDFIFEACEYKDSFLSFRPTVSVVLNEEMDHPDFFKSMEQIHESFHRYLEIPGPDGYAVINADDKNVQISAEGCSANIITFGTETESADYRAVRITFTDGFPSFDVLRHGSPYLHVTLHVPGLHNVSNALACCACADLCGLSADTIASGLASFGGAGRRMEYKGLLRGCPVSVPVYDDFGHHPSEIRTTLEGARRLGAKRLRCVFQPHTYSRTAELFDDFCHAFGAADEVIFADIYAARETNTYGVSSQQLAENTEHAHYDPDWEHLLTYLKESAQPGDLLVIMGAGDISRFSARIASLG